MFLESIDDNLLSQAEEDPVRNNVLLNLILTIREGLVVDVKLGFKPWLLCLRMRLEFSWG